MNELIPITTKWYDIGIQLDLTPEELDMINLEHKDSLQAKLRSLLIWWLNRVTPQPSWQALIAALRTSAVNEQGLANKLEQQYNQKPSPNTM